MNQQVDVYPVIVNSYVHTASNGVYLSLKKTGIPCIYTNYMSWDVFMRQSPQWRETFSEALQVRSKIDEFRGKVRWKIVTMVRDPLARILSGYFQMLRQRFTAKVGGGKS